jgi:outer membrane protein
MRRNLTGFSLIAAVILSVTAFAQTGKAAATPGSGAPASSAAVAPPNKVGIINIQQAILSSNEGRRDFEALSKKYEPKQAELTRANAEIDALKKQLSTQENTLNEEARAKLVKQIDTKQRDLQHAAESAQADFQSEQNDLANKIGSKIMQVLDKYAKDNAYAVILDVSNQQSPVLWADIRSVDVTDPIVAAYNTQSGVPAQPTAAVRPPAPAGTAPPRPKPAAPATTPPTTPKQ